MIGTVLVLWIAHVYAHGLEESIQAGRRLQWHEFVRVAHREWSIALAAVPPGIFLLLGILGVFKESTAIWLALIAGLVVLAAQGVRYAMLERLTPLASIFSVGLNVARSAWRSSCSRRSSPTDRMTCPLARGCILEGPWRRT
jgi:hypothetical protein